MRNRQPRGVDGVVPSRRPHVLAIREQMNGEGKGRFVVGWWEWWWSRDHVWWRSRWLGWRGSRRGWRRGSLLGRSVLLLGRWLGGSLFGWGLFGRRLLGRNFFGGRLEPRSPLVGDGARTRTGQQRDRHHQDVRLPHGREAPAFETAALLSRSGRIARTSMCDSERSASGACALRGGGEAHSPDRQRHDHEIGKTTLEDQRGSTTGRCRCPGTGT